MIISVILAVGLYIAFKMVMIVGDELFVDGKKPKIFYLIPVLYNGVFVVTVILWRWTGF